MKLKPIEDGMIVHVTNEKDAKTLIKWAYKCGYKWLFNPPTQTNFEAYGNEMCYKFYNTEISFSGREYYETKSHEKIIEFSNLIIPEEEKNHMTAEEVIEWLRKHNSDKVWDEIFGEENDFYDICAYNSASDIVSIIEAYEDRKKEPEYKWIYRVYNFKKVNYEFYDYETDAIARCEYLAKTSNNKNAYFKYDKVCVIKE